MHLTGNILVSLTDEIPETHDTVVKSGLALALLSAPHCFTDQQEITEVKLNSHILQTNITDILLLGWCRYGCVWFSGLDQWAVDLIFFINALTAKS